MRPGADPPAQLEAVRSGKHQVEHDEVGPLGLDQLARAVAVGRLQGAVPVALQVRDDDLADRRLVVDDENSGHARIVPVFALRESELPGKADQAAVHLDETVLHQRCHCSRIEAVMRLRAFCDEP